MGAINDKNIFRSVTTQTIGYTGSSVAVTNAFGTQTYAVRIASTSACNYQIGDGAQTASATASPLLPANWVENVTVSPGQRISAIRASSDGLITATSGTLFVTELTT